MFKVSAEI